MNRLVALIALIACGAPEVPSSKCVPMGRGSSPGITTKVVGATNAYSSSVALPVSMASALVEWPADADPRNAVQLGAMVYACDGRNLGSVLFATARAPDAASLSATVSMDAFPEAASLELMVTPLFVGGTGSVDVHDFEAVH